MNDGDNLSEYDVALDTACAPELPNDLEQLEDIFLSHNVFPTPALIEQLDRFIDRKAIERGESVDQAKRDFDWRYSATKVLDIIASDDDSVLRAGQKAWLLKHRLKLGNARTQKELADKFGCTQQRISQLLVSLDGILSRKSRDETQGERSTTCNSLKVDANDLSSSSETKTATSKF